MPKWPSYDTQTALLRYLKRPFRNTNLYYLNLLKLLKTPEKRAKNVGLKSSCTALNNLWLNALHAKM